VNEESQDKVAVRKCNAAQEKGKGCGSKVCELQIAVAWPAEENPERVQEIKLE